MLLDKTLLESLIKTKMPYGKYKDVLICDIPEHYLLWFVQKGLPKGKLGELLGLMYEIRLNGLEHLITKLKSF